MFKIKICGMTDPAAVVHAISAGADAIGVNLVPSSRRYVDARVATDLTAAAAGALRIAVVADAEPKQILELVRGGHYDAIQLHGSESPANFPELPVPIIRAIRLRESGLNKARQAIDPWLERDQAPAALLLDAWSPNELGGTGRLADWDVAADLVRAVKPLPVILAGGLTPANVATAIRHVRPFGVDTASGVESSPGRKDPSLVTRFIQQARQAMDRL